jgi:hypothetical protein
MTRGLMTLLLACVPVAVGGLGLMAHAAGPQHDVFERPKPRSLKQHDPETVKSMKPAPAPVEWKPELRAIISGGGKAWVNVEGRILQVGQDMDGFRLVEVQERRAIFVKDDVRYALDLPAVKAGSRPSAGGGVKSATDTASGSASKGAGDAAASSSAKATDAASPAGSKVAPEPAPASSPVAKEPVPIGSIKSSAILPKPDASRAGGPWGAPGKFAEASGR